MEFSPHKYVCQQNCLEKLERGIVHRAVNKLMSMESPSETKIFDDLICSEPFMFCSWTPDTGRKVAYGREALPRLKKEMSHSNELIACCAIRQLSDLLHDPEIAVEAVRINIVPRFVKNLRSTNTILVEKTLSCIRALTYQPMGLTAIISNKYIIKIIRKRLLHELADVRMCAGQTVNAMAQNYLAVRTLVEAGYVKVLMKSLLEVKDCKAGQEPFGFTHTKDILELMVLHLDTLDKLMEDSDDPKVEAIAHDAFLLSPLLRDECIEILRSSASFFCQIAKHSIGKEGIYKYGLILDLCKGVVDHEDIEVKTRMAGALQFATIHKEARKQAFTTDLFPYLLSLMTQNNVPTELKKYGIRILTNFAELPDGRKYFKDLLKTRSENCLIKTDGSQEMNNLVQTLLDVIQWEPHGSPALKIKIIPC